MASTRNPSTWDEYDHGSSPHRSGSTDSIGNRSVQWEEESLLGRSFGDNVDGNVDGERPRLRHRRSSLTNRLTALTEIGGVNSIRSFTRSWQRAAGFAEVIPQRPNFVFAPDQEPVGAHEGIQYGRNDVESAAEATDATPRASLLGQQIVAGARPDGDGDMRNESLEPGTSSASLSPQIQPGDYREREREQKITENELSQAFRVGSNTSTSIFGVPPHLSTPPIIGSYASFGSYGTIGSDVSRPSMGQAAAIWRQQQEAANQPSNEVQPILVKEVEQDGKIVLAVEGQSTLPQTIFNSINVLIGVGLLSLPMGINYSGWLIGMVFLFLAATVTSYTAKLLARCMDLDSSLISFSDVAYISFGQNARIATSILFTLELVAACVALIVLFADSLDLLFPGVLTLVQWKVLCALILIPLNFLPLRLLSFTSFIGILSCFSIVGIIIIDGLIKPDAPGSLISPAKTYMFPANWMTLPLSFGLLMSPWGGHGVFPNIYRDMRHPYKYQKAVKITFSFTYILDATTAVAGLLMFGDDVHDEITSNILSSTGYSRALTFLMVMFIAIIPLTKIPLNARPIISTVEVLCGLNQLPASGSAGRNESFRGIMRVVICAGTILALTLIAILFPAFDSIMAFMGSGLCFTICVTLPLAFTLKLFRDSIPARQKIFMWTLMVISTTLSVVGTIWAFLPKSVLGIESTGAK